MAKPFSLTHHLSSLFLSRPRLFLLPSATLHHHHHHFLKSPSPLLFPRPLSTNPTPYPLQYELIINRPVQQSHTPRARRNANPIPEEPHEPDEDEPDEPTSELRLDSWVDRKLAEPGQPGYEQLDKAKRKYYNKRRKRMYGSDSEEEENLRKSEEKFVELKPEVVEFRTLHRREEELYFYDAFTYPWEKDKHYKMVYQLEKKYFPEHCLDKAFLEPGQSNSNANANGNENENVNVKSKGKGRKSVGGVMGEKKGDEGDNKLVFFEEKGKGGGDDVDLVKVGKDVREKKVEEFFKGLKRVENKDVEASGGVSGEPYLSSRSTGLPPVWDSPHGTVVLINKPKGEFTLHTFALRTR